MTLTEIVKEFGQVPNKAKLHNGTEIELSMRKRFNNKGYIASVWIVKDHVFEQIIEIGEGLTVESAKEDLKNKILAG